MSKINLRFQEIIDEIEHSDNKSILAMPVDKNIFKNSKLELSNLEKEMELTKLLKTICGKLQKR